MYGLFYHNNGLTDTIEVRDMQTACARNILNASRGLKFTDWLIVGYTESYDDAMDIVNTGKLLSIIRAAKKEHFDLESEIDYLTALCAANGIDTASEEGANDEK